MASMACGAWRMQDLGGGVGDDGPAEVGAEEVGGVLGDDGQAGAAFAGGLGHPEQEPGALAVAEQQPGFVDHDRAVAVPTRVAGGRWDVDVAPDRVEGQQRADGREFVGQVPGGPDDQVPVGAVWWWARRTGP